MLNSTLVVYGQQCDKKIILKTTEGLTLSQTLSCKYPAICFIKINKNELQQGNDAEKRLLAIVFAPTLLKSKTTSHL